jgi:hypothetical protein
MRALLLVSTLALGFTSTPSMVQAQSCPKDASSASYAVWPAGSVRDGQTATGTHPCGRRLTCFPGKLGVNGSRKCHWL